MLFEPMPGEMEELRQNFNAALGSMAGLLSTIQKSIGTILGETENLTAAAGELGRRTERQAASLAETAAAVNQLSASVESSSAAHTAPPVWSTGRVSNRPKAAWLVARTVTAMNGHRRQFRADLADHRRDRGHRALRPTCSRSTPGSRRRGRGRMVRGFAVVASEVRSLQRSSDAAREIAGIIATSGDQASASGVNLVIRTDRARRDRRSGG
ncbi:MAG: hypothetical protein R3D59_17280 [Paracoccaceae bacterium]